MKRPHRAYVIGVASILFALLVVSAQAAPNATATWNALDRSDVWGYTFSYNRLDPDKSACWNDLQTISNIIEYTDARREAETDCIEASKLDPNDIDGGNFKDLPGAEVNSYTVLIEFGYVYAFRLTSNKLAPDGTKDIIGRRWGPTVLGSATLGEHPIIVIDMQFGNSDDH